MTGLKKWAVALAAVALTATSAMAGEVTRASWIEAMSTALPTVFCQPQQYFRQCFNVSQEKCEEVAASATRICLKKYAEDIPEMLQQPKDGTHWGSIVGRCAGEAYEIALKSERKNTATCNNPENWR